ncbi:MAG TPA: hypothetical protein VGG11_03300 [Xanthobacteraceae bacterium]|jgi:hypothetical protein
MANGKDGASPTATPDSAGDDQIFASNLTLHDLFQKQSAAMLERADLSDEQKQEILIAMSCPCCGAGGFSFTAKLKRK